VSDRLVSHLSFHVEASLGEVSFPIAMGL